MVPMSGITRTLLGGGNPLDQMTVASEAGSKAAGRKRLVAQSVALSTRCC